MVREMGILMSQPMVLAGLDKVKTQTRRIMNPQPHNEFGLMRWTKGEVDINMRDNPELACLYAPYKVGGRLYWKETHYKYGYWMKTPGGWIFKPNCDFGVWFPNNIPKEFTVLKGYGDLGWYKRSSLFMFKKDARIWSTVLKVESQQLKDITEEDAIAEGMTEKVSTYCGYSLGQRTPDDGDYYRNIYHILWHCLNGKWNPNLWVWKYTMSEPEIRQ